MADLHQSPATSDICLLLRVHGEHLWLSAKVVPVLRELEHRDAVPDDQLGGALAYLDVLWIEARCRAAETDAAHARCQRAHHGEDPSLHEKAHRYHAAVRRMRDALRHRVERLLAPADDIAQSPAVCDYQVHDASMSDRPASL